MAHVESLHYYPLTGAQALSPPEVGLGAAGIRLDRLFMLFDRKTDPLAAENRVSQKQIKELASLAIAPRVTSTYPTFSITNKEHVTYLLAERDGTEPDTIINEFGDMVPAITMGYAKEFIGTLKKQASEDGRDTGSQEIDLTNIMLAQKHDSWLSAGYNDTLRRKVAPLHIVTMASVAELQRRHGRADFGYERFRPNVVINNVGEEPFSENYWAGGILNIAGIPIMIQRATQRCVVPGFDQTTGMNMKDVPKLYSHLDHVGGKPIFGVYGYPILNAAETEIIATGDRVQLEAA
jgi:uncharacterized protein YcbX